MGYKPAALFLITVLGSVGSMSLLHVSRRPHYIECVSNADCGLGNCCVLGMNRYSVPVCQSKLELYEMCRPQSQMPINSTVAYLDGSVVSLHEVHLLMCPCSDGLVCSTIDGRCTQGTVLVNENRIDEEYDIDQ